MHIFFLDSNFKNIENNIITIFTIVALAIFFVVLAVFLFIDYKNSKSMELRRMLYKNFQKTPKFEVTTVYTDKSKNYSGTEILPEPTKESDKQYTYIFAGWDKNHFNESGDTVARAVFVKKLNSCIVNFYLDDKSTLLKTVEVKYGEAVNVDEIIPTKNDTLEFTYKFSGWSKDLSKVEQDENVYAVFDAYPKKYTYTFLDSDHKTILSQKTELCGTKIIAPEVKEIDENGYKFSHFSNYVKDMVLEKNEVFVAVYVSEDGTNSTYKPNYKLTNGFIKSDDVLLSSNMVNATVENNEAHFDFDKENDSITLSNYNLSIINQVTEESDDNSYSEMAEENVEELNGQSEIIEQTDTKQESSNNENDANNDFENNIQENVIEGLNTDSLNEGFVSENNDNVANIESENDGYDFDEASKVAMSYLSKVKEYDSEDEAVENDFEIENIKNGNNSFEIVENADNEKAVSNVENSENSDNSVSERIVEDFDDIYGMGDDDYGNTSFVPNDNYIEDKRQVFVVETIEEEEDFTDNNFTPVMSASEECIIRQDKIIEIPEKKSEDVSDVQKVIEKPKPKTITKKKDGVVIEISVGEPTISNKLKKNSDEERYQAERQMKSRMMFQNNFNANYVGKNQQKEKKKTEEVKRDEGDFMRKISVIATQKKTEAVRNSQEKKSFYNAVNVNSGRYGTKMTRTENGRFSVAPEENKSNRNLQKNRSGGNKFSSININYISDNDSDDEK